MIVKATEGKGNLVMITGKPGQFDVVQRADGAKKAFADAGADIKILAEEPADWSKDKALTVMQDLLTRHPDIDIVFGQDDPMALGALQAIKAAGVEGIKVFGVNGNKDACDAIKAGDMYGTAMQLSYMVGVYTVRAAYDIVQGPAGADEDPRADRAGHAGERRQPRGAVLVGQPTLRRARDRARRNPRA